MSGAVERDAPLIDLADVPLALTLLGDDTVLAQALRQLLHDVSDDSDVIAQFCQLVSLPPPLPQHRKRPDPPGPAQHGPAPGP